MDEQPTPEPWAWQGFFGPAAAAQAAYAAVQIGGDIGALVPLEGGPRAVDVDGEVMMFAVQVRPDAPMACPEDMTEADPAIVGRLVGA
ncbi:hypothetical protein [Roseococcus thiosulfatophilus]|uniref:hypothetical protein n=1 Tax=Roseococcus thiosulfatophilus TaxID=35813 RepID=UPI001A8C9C8A|nr:hypothetical protein [Roseococcus thiosulfatophilus]